MYDIHTHILASVDDGCKNFETSIQMCKTAQDDGITTIAATPHYIAGCSTNPTAEVIRDMVKELNKNLVERNIFIQVLPGMEVFISPELPELYRSGEILTLNDTRYLLIELPQNSLPLYTEEVIFRLQVCGAVPIIAHPERNHVLRRDIERLIEMADRGVLFQINAGSFKGDFGKEVCKFAFKLLTLRLVHFIASDAHSNNVRKPELAKVYEIIRKQDESEFEKIFNNSYRVICNKEIISRHIFMKGKKKTNFNLKHILSTVMKK